MGYRFGFQGQEKETELFGGQASWFKYRISDNRIGRFISPDPLFRKYPHNSVYAFSENRVIYGVELEGLEYAPPPDPSGGYSKSLQMQGEAGAKAAGVAIDGVKGASNWTYNNVLKDGALEGRNDGANVGYGSRTEQGLNSALYNTVSGGVGCIVETMGAPISGGTSLLGAVASADQFVEGLNTFGAVFAGTYHPNNTYSSIKLAAETASSELTGNKDYGTIAYNLYSVGTSVATLSKLSVPTSIKAPLTKVTSAKSVAAISTMVYSAVEGITSDGAELIDVSKGVFSQLKDNTSVRKPIVKPLER